MLDSIFWENVKRTEFPFLMYRCKNFENVKLISIYLQGRGIYFSTMYLSFQKTLSFTEATRYSEVPISRMIATLEAQYFPVSMLIGTMRTTCVS